MLVKPFVGLADESAVKSSLTVARLEEMSGGWGDAGTGRPSACCGSLAPHTRALLSQPLPLVYRSGGCRPPSTRRRLRRDRANIRCRPGEPLDASRSSGRPPPNRWTRKVDVVLPGVAIAVLMEAP